MEPFRAFVADLLPEEQRTTLLLALASAGLLAWDEEWSSESSEDSSDESSSDSS